MKTTPILFSAPMIRALLSGAKTQTRRIVKFNVSGRIERAGRQWHPEDPNAILPCPYGAPGDRLWVKEEHYRYGHWEPVPGVKTKKGRQKWKFVPDTDEVLYVEPSALVRKGRHHKDPETPAWHKRLARFMPRSLSRLTLELTEVRVERVQDISEADAVAEGAVAMREWRMWRVFGEKGNYSVGGPEPVDGTDPHGDGNIIIAHRDQVVSAARPARDDFESIWNRVNGPGAWERNDWTWALTFRKVEGGAA